MQEYNGVNYPTLRRIKEGLPIKPATYKFYRKLFKRLLLNEYNKRIEHGDTGREILHVLAEFTLQEDDMSFDDTDQVKR